MKRCPVRQNTCRGCGRLELPYLVKNRNDQLKLNQLYHKGGEAKRIMSANCLPNSPNKRGVIVGENLLTLARHSGIVVLTESNGGSVNSRKEVPIAVPDWEVKRLAGNYKR